MGRSRLTRAAPPKDARAAPAALGEQAGADLTEDGEEDPTASPHPQRAHHIAGSRQKSVRDLSRTDGVRSLIHIIRPMSLTPRPKLNTLAPLSCIQGYPAGQRINREVFDRYVETQLAPTLHKGCVVVLDTLATHPSPKTAALLKDIGAGFVFWESRPMDACVIPQTVAAILSRPHPIEMAFARIKIVRRENDPPDHFLNRLTRKGRSRNIRPTLASCRKRL